MRCDELGLQSTICLPIPPNSFAEKCYSRSGNWRTRFVKLTNRNDDRLRILSRSDGLPNWLRSKEQDPWRRGNHWVLEMAKAIPAKRHILIVLWDGKREDDSGGTAHVVALAERRGFEIVELRTQELLLDRLQSEKKKDRAGRRARVTEHAGGLRRQHRRR